MNWLKQNWVKVISIVFAMLAIGAGTYFVLGTKNIASQPTSSNPICEEYNPNEDYTKLSHEECLNNEGCKFTAYMALQDLQRKLLIKFGSSFDPALQSDPSSTPASQTFQTKLEELTNGDAFIPDHAIELSDKDLDSFEKQSINRPPVIFLRKTFNDYLNGKDISIFSENITKKCHTVYGTTFGLDGFDKAYYRSRFTPFGIFKHVGQGYDIFLLFADKPDHLLRVWVSDADDKGNFQLKTIEDAGVPKTEVEGLYNAFKKYLSNPKFSI